MPARWPDHSVVRRKISLLTTSSAFWVSPCTLTTGACDFEASISCALIGSPSSPKETARPIALAASATSRISAFSAPLAPGKRERCSIRYWVSVRRFDSGMSFSLDSGNRRLEHPAGQDVGRHDGGQVGLGQHAVAVGKQSRGGAQAGAVQRVAHAARVGEVRLPSAALDVLREGPARALAEAIV